MTVPVLARVMKALKRPNKIVTKRMSVNDKSYWPADSGCAGHFTVYVSSSPKRKGIDTALHAIPEERNGNQNIIAGDQPGRDGIELE